MNLSHPVLAFITGMPGWAEIVVILGIGVLIFGKRLPEVGRNVGRGIVEFKKGLKGIEHDVDDAVSEADRRQVLGSDDTSHGTLDSGETPSPDDTTKRTFSGDDDSA